ncbi:hypothetical protein GCM10009712_31320 [Pseudarthrobacter sulfonivorans]
MLIKQALYGLKHFKTSFDSYKSSNKQTRATGHGRRLNAEAARVFRPGSGR